VAKMMKEFGYVKGFCQGQGLAHSVKALSFMYRHHGSQTRNDGTPYFTHPLKVANNLIALNFFVEDTFIRDVLISSAILHDILEDTSVTAQELTKEFCPEITEVVLLLTKTDELSNEDYYANIRFSLLASLVKIADRCHNVSTMAGVFNKKRLVKYVKETEEMVKPLIRHVRDNNPPISQQVVQMSYHIKSVIGAIEVMIPLMPDEE
jgi:GTP pyrophosphokinase